MPRIGGTCPVCGESLRIERLRCWQCGTALEGSFELSPLFSLEPEELHFVELLVKHRGNIQRVAEEMAVSYRTGRTRMDEIANAMGYIEDETVVVTPERRQEILEGVQSGQYSAEQAIRLLRGEEEE